MGKPHAMNRYFIREAGKMHVVMDKKYGIVVERCATRNAAQAVINSLT